MPRASLGGSLKSTSGSDPCFFQIAASSLGARAREILCVLFMSEDFISPSPVGLLQLSTAGLQFQMLWGLVFLVPEPWAWEPDVGLRTLTPVGEPL